MVGRNFSNGLTGAILYALWGRLCETSIASDAPAPFVIIIREKAHHKMALDVWVIYVFAKLMSIVLLIDDDLLNQTNTEQIFLFLDRHRADMPRRLLWTDSVYEPHRVRRARYPAQGLRIDIG